MNLAELLSVLIVLLLVLACAGAFLICACACAMHARNRECRACVEARLARAHNPIRMPITAGERHV